MSVHGDQWRYRDIAGTGPTLIMLPGVHGSADLFYESAMRLSGQLNILTVTYPALADTDRLATDLAGFMDTLAVRTASFCGAFLGGYIAQKFAHRYPQRMETLFFANSFHDSTALKTGLPDPDQFAALPAAEIHDRYL